MVPAIDIPGARDRHGGRARGRRLRRAPLHRPRRAHQSGRPSRARARSSSIVGMPERRRRAARRHVRDRPHRARRQRAGAVAAGDAPCAPRPGQTFVWTIDDGKLVKRIVVARPPRRREPGASRSRPRCRRTLPVLATRFDNLKEGAPALVKAPARRRRAPASAPTSGRTQAAGLTPRPTAGIAAMWITRVSINNPVFATMVMVGITVLGLFSYNRLRVEQMPDVSLPFVLVHDAATRARRPRRSRPTSRSRSSTRSTPCPASSSSARNSREGHEPGVRRVPPRRPT